MVALTSRGHYCLCIACAEAAEQVTTVYMDEFPPRQAQAVALWSSQEFDGFIVGGGATESGHTSMHSQAVNLKTAPVQGDNFSSGTSSRSTKLIHGGVRYLQKAIMKLDYKQVNASFFLHKLVRCAPCVAGAAIALMQSDRDRCDISVPTHFHTTSHRLGVTHIPLLWSCPPAAGQHNDARMNLAIALTAARYGAAIANYTEVVVCGALCRDVITGQEFDVRAKCVINATGPFTDALWKMDDQKNPDICQPSAGVHIVIPGYYSSWIPSRHLLTDQGKDAPTHPHTARAIRVEEEDMDFILTEVHNYEAASART
uniref:glycerol-3-phosphate dehydrogenase n=1 Tax=Seriola dumerili TaxID=41447 RepID=A0A3B4V4R4_SERDU